MAARRVSLAATVASGNRRASLEAVRDHLAAALVNVDPRYSAALAKQLTDTMRELSSLPEPKGSVVDELAERAARRRTAAAG